MGHYYPPVDDSRRNVHGGDEKLLDEQSVVSLCKPRRERSDELSLGVSGVSRAQQSAAPCEGESSGKRRHAMLTVPNSRNPGDHNREGMQNREISDRACMERNSY